MRNLMDILADLKVINDKIAAVGDDNSGDAELQRLRPQKLRLEKELDKVRTSCLKHSKTSKR
jgi:uncharacterized protein YdcH (DUF465 family)